MFKLKRRDGGKIWQISGSIDGKQIRISTGETLKRLAEEKLREEENEYLNQSKGIKKHLPNLEKSASEYINIKNLDSDLQRQIKKVTDVYGHLLIDKVTPNFNENIKACLSSGLKNSSINRCTASIQAIVNVQLRKLKLNTLTIQKYPEDESLITYHTDEEVNKLIEHSGKIKPLVCFLYYTGCRISEAVNIEWKDINYDKQEIAVFMTKTKKYKYIPIHPKLKLELGTPAVGKVFPYSSRHTIKRPWKKMQELSGVKTNPHKFRHTFATKMIQNTDLKTMMAVGGWQTEKMALRYAKVVNERKIQAINHL